jgi:hypothetical protein
MSEPAYDVFISYARRDGVRVRIIRDRLAALGLSVFFDTEGIDTGDEFPVIIDRAVKSAKCVLGLWSRAAFTGRWVRIESRIGLDQNKLVAATLDSLRPDELPAEFYNVNVVSLADFDGEAAHEGWARIVRAIGKRVARDDLAGVPLPTPRAPAFGLKREYVIGGALAAAAVALVAANNIQLAPSHVAASEAQASGPVVDMNGRWAGVYTEAGRDTRFELELRRGGDGAFTGSVSEQDIYGIGGGSFSAQISGEALPGGVVRFTKTYPAGGPATRPVIYEGRISDDGRTLAGSWDTGTLHGPFHMVRQ